MTLVLLVEIHVGESIQFNSHIYDIETIQTTLIAEIAI